MKQAKRGFTFVQQVINQVISAILLLIMIVIFAQTFFRFVINSSIPWSEEVSRYLFVALILLGANVGISQNMLVRIDIVDGFLNDTWKWIFDMVRELIAVVVCSFFLYSTFDMIRIGAMQKSPALQLPMSVMYSIMAVGFALMVVAALFRLLETVMNKEEREYD